MGFFPRDKLGFVILTNLDSALGSSFANAVQSSLMSRLFGLNQTLPALLARYVPQIDKGLAQLAAQTRPVDGAAVAPHLGLYRDGFRLRLDDARVLRLDHVIRSLPMLALQGGGYVTTEGPGVAAWKKVTFTTEDGKRPVMTIAGFDPVAWLTGA